MNAYHAFMSHIRPGIPPASTLGIAACALIMRDDGSVLSVSSAVDPEMLGLPGGKLELGEDPLAAAQRELREETGIEVVGSGTEVHKAVVLGSGPDGRDFEVVTYRFDHSQIVRYDPGQAEPKSVHAWVSPERLCASTARVPAYNAHALAQMGAQLPAGPHRVFCTTELADWVVATYRSDGLSVKVVDATAGGVLTSPTLQVGWVSACGAAVRGGAIVVVDACASAVRKMHRGDVGDALVTRHWAS